MAIVRSFGTVQAYAAPTPTWSGPSSPAGSWPGNALSYAALYRTQPNVRTVVDFLARNIAQLGIGAFRRVSDTDRERLSGHDVVRWLQRPNPYTTRYRLIESTVQDLGVYFNAFWLKVRTSQTLGLVRLPPDQVQVEGGLFPSLFVWTSSTGTPREFPPSEIVHFSGYNPDNTLLGLSPLETLRRTLVEEITAQDYRAHYWRNHARMDGVIERDKAQKPWTPDQFNAWREQWNTAYTGRENSGKTAVLMPGMTWKDRSFSAKDSELNSARKLTREEVARAYHIPLPMVGILDHATFSNIREQHKNLYQDSLGPWTVMIEEELERQLLIESTDQENVYLEFNIAEKLKGSFEEQADAILKLTGRPIMTANEGRARLNLSRMGDESADELALQLNTATPSTSDQAAAEPDDQAVARVVARHQSRQNARLEKFEPEERPGEFNLTRWNRELADDLVGLGMAKDRARLLAARVNETRLTELMEAIA